MSQRKSSLYKAPLEGRRESEIVATTNKIRTKQLESFYLTAPSEDIAQSASSQWKIPPQQFPGSILPDLEPVPGFTENQLMRRPDMKPQKKYGGALSSVDSKKLSSSRKSASQMSFEPPVLIEEVLLQHIMAKIRQLLNFM